jgi:hypothetical protein
MKSKETEPKSNFDLMVKEMKKKGDFDNLENKVIAKLFLDQEKALTQANFNAQERKAIRRLLKHPFKILKQKNGVLSLTKNGESLAKGYLKALVHAKTLF